MKPKKQLATAPAITLRVLGRGTVLASDRWRPAADRSLVLEVEAMKVVRANRVQAPPVAHLTAMPESALEPTGLADALRKTGRASVVVEAIALSDGTPATSLIASFEASPGFRVKQRHVLFESEGARQHLCATVAASAFAELDREILRIVSSFRAMRKKAA